MSYPTKFGEGTESPAELALALAMDAAGLEYEKQKEIPCGSGQGRRRIDFYFPRHRLAVEVDGFSFHKDEASFEADRFKDLAALIDDGIRTVRLAAKWVFADPHRCAEVVRSALDSVGVSKIDNERRTVGLGCNDGYGDPLRPGRMGGLQCPSCFGECLHIVRTVERKGGSDGHRTTVDITYDCEQCGHLSTMTHTNHKGDAMIAWSKVGGVNIAKQHYT